MKFLSELAFWLPAALSISAFAILSFKKSIGKATLAGTFLIWVMAAATTFVCYGTLPALFSAAFSGSTGMLFVIASLIHSGLTSLPKRRFEDR
ncbi:MAG: hypothetical protein WCK32_06460 [Chlorobiaceae bacterium]